MRPGGAAEKPQINRLPPSRDHPPSCSHCRVWRQTPRSMAQQAPSSRTAIAQVLHRNPRRGSSDGGSPKGSTEALRAQAAHPKPLARMSMIS